MGYVFDALNRNDDGQPTDPTPAAPTPGGEGERQETAGPCDAPASETPQDAAESLKFEQWADSKSAQGTASTAQAHPVVPQGPPLKFTSKWTENLDDRLVSLTEPSSQLAEEYRAIRTSTLARWDHKRNLIHTITSATPQEGKTITSLNLGLSFAELRNRKTIVIEADLRLPTFNKLLHLGESPGMVGYLRGEAELDEVIQKLEGNALHVITSGSRASNDAVQLLSNQRMARLLDVLREKYDHVIIDTPPVIELADAGIVGGLSDEVMLIARISRTPQPLIQQALRALNSYNAPVAGVVVTDQERSKNRYHYYRYGYRYRYRYYAKRAA
jgi:protein-tyrosine kinase